MKIIIITDEDPDQGPFADWEIRALAIDEIQNGRCEILRSYMARRVSTDTPGQTDLESDLEQRED